MKTGNFERCLGYGCLLMVLAAITPVIAMDDPTVDPTHFDLYIETTPAAQTGARFQIDPDDSFPVDILSGRTVVPTNLSDIAGGPHLTDDPGWFIEPGFLIDGEDLRFRALGALSYWDPAVGIWQNTVPNGETVRIFGGVPSDIIADLFADLDLFQFWLDGTIWSTDGIEGPPEAVIAETRSGDNGQVHSHLDFCIQDAGGDCPSSIGGNPAAGAYRIELELFSSAQAGTANKYVDSRPVMIVLGYELTPDQLQAAVDSLTQIPPSTQDVPQLPASGVLIMGGPE